MPNHSTAPQTIENVSVAGLEIVKELYERQIVLDAIVLVAGNGTSVHGIAPHIRKHHPAAIIVAVEDARNHPVQDDKLRVIPELRRYEPHDTYGSSYAGTPVKYKIDKIVDAVDTVASQPRDTMRDSFNEAYFDTDDGVGNSTGMSLVVAGRIMETLNKKSGANVALLAYDSISRY